MILHLPTAVGLIGGSVSLKQPSKESLALARYSVTVVISMNTTNTLQ